MKRVVLALLLTFPLHAAIRGVVITTDGKPVAHAKVEALAPRAWLGEEVVQDDAQPLAVATTNGEGSYTLEVGGHGLVVVRVMADGYGVKSALAATDDDAVQVALPVAPVVEGRVSAGGKPVVGAEVLVMSATRVLLRLTTDAAGRYRVADPKVWASAILVRHRDYAPQWHQPADRNFALDAGRAVEGRVVDAKEKPVAGVRVELAPWTATTSGSDGTFRFEHMPGNGAVLRARTADTTAAAQVAGGRTTLRLRPAATIRGVVRDEEKRPLSGIAISAVTQEGESTTVSGSDGSYTLFVDRGPHGVADGGNGIYEVAMVNANAEGDLRLDLVAKRQPVIAGVVRDAAGNGIAAAAIHYLLITPVGPAVQPSNTLTDAAGRFRVRFASFEDADVRLVAIKPGMPLGRSEKIEAKTRNVVITIAAGVPVSGRVVDVDKHPLAGVELHLLPGALSGDVVETDVSRVPWAVTDADGRYHARIGEGSMTLAFAKRGYVELEQTVDVTASVKAIDVTLTAASHIAGRTLKKDGTPAPHVPVALDEMRTITSGDDGSFRFDEVRPGAVSVQFGPTLMESQPVTAPADDVKLVLPAMRSVHGRVVDAASGAPVEAFTVIGDRVSQPFESPKGEFTLDVPEKLETISVMASGYPSAKQVAVTNEPLVVQLARGHTLRGHVKNEQGEPLGGVVIGAHTEGEGQSVESAGDGSFEVSNLPADAGSELDFVKRGFVRKSIGVKAGQETLDVVLRRGVTVTGRVVDRTGAAVADVMVGASSAVHGAAPLSVSTNERGEFLFDALAPGRWDIETQRENERGAAKDVDIEKVHDVTLRLEAHPTSTIAGRVTGLDPSWTVRFVTAYDAIESMTQTAPIDAAGNYRMERAPVGSVRVSAIAGGMTERVEHHSKSVTIDVAAGAEARADLQFLPPMPVHGHVVRNGVPLEGVTVELSSEGAVTTGAGGAYALQVMGGEYDVKLYLDRRQLPFAQHIVINEPAELNFSVDVAKLTVSVVDEAGRPLTHAYVSAMPHPFTHPTVEAWTGADGTATLEVASGEVEQVHAAMEGFAAATQEVTSSGTSSVTFRLLRASDVHVRIVDVRDGRTLSGYAIARDAAGRVLASANQADADGIMTFALTPGTYRFSASAERYGSHTITAEVPSGEVRIALPRGGTLALRASTDLHATARLIQSDGEEYVRCWCNGIAEITLDGRAINVDQIAPGAYTLEVTPRGGKPRRYPVTVVEGVTTTVELLGN